MSDRKVVLNSCLKSGWREGGREGKEGGSYDTSVLCYPRARGYLEGKENFPEVAYTPK